MTSASSAPQRQSCAKLERRWLLKVQAALARYRSAEKQHCRTAVELALKLIAPADGKFAEANSRVAAAKALAEYERVLEIYEDLLVDGKIPAAEDDDDR